MPAYQRELAATHNNLGVLLRRLGKREEALKEYGNARAIQVELAETHPEFAEFKADLGGTYINLARLLREMPNRLGMPWVNTQPNERVVGGLQPQSSEDGLHG